MDNVRAEALTAALFAIAAAIDRVADGLADRGPEAAAQPAFRIDDIREKYPQAYARWSPEDDARLKEAYASGQDIESLAIALAVTRGRSGPA